MEYSLSRIAEITGGTLSGDDARVLGVSIDTRTIKRGELYVAIIGKAMDGHDFCAAAMEAGAAACLVSRSTAPPSIEVSDTVKAIQDLAKDYREQFNIPIVGITGSAGKTTTKDMTAALLSERYNTLKTSGNLNNQTGVPQVIFKLSKEHEAAVIEMGTNHFGEIEALSRMVQPTVCVFTNIGDAHMEFFKDRRGTLRAKGEMLKYARSGACVIVNGDDELLIELRHDISYGFSKHCTLRCTSLRERGIFGTDFTVEYGGKSSEFFIPLAGRHMVYNALAAIAAGFELGISAEQAQAALSNFSPSEGRAQLVRGRDCMVINDAYNANPVSMKAALEGLKKAEGRTVAILGDMGELGEDSLRFHEEVVKAAVQMGIDEIILIGSSFLSTETQGVHRFSSIEEAIPSISELVRAGDTVLVKASHSMHLERLIPPLTR
ncbi:MAG: UDP-N-acetylmuramoyl-tripeptide--D-alanyl-D-alanine ligase [Clostridia bacterium]|nr:UDP-N-acetylmuramoyl-tripeptide--D-alanyl-D-alanine ligase [Clostridia bacterium]